MDNISPFETSYRSCNALACLGLSAKLKTALSRTYVRPVVLCVGSDRVLGDSLGPMVGTLLQEKRASAYIYGTLSRPVSAREVPHIGKFLACTHPRAAIVAVDAAVGSKEEVGLIKLSSYPLYPGSGSGKQLGAVGDLSILGIVARREDGFAALETPHLGSIRNMAEVIAEAIALSLFPFTAHREQSQETRSALCL